MTTDIWPAFLLRIPGDRPGGDRERGQADGKPGLAETDDEPAIRCRSCLQEITRPSQRIAMDGAHRHTFANPHGIVHDIGCFRSVTHCGHAGEPTGEFTWFAGYTWRVVYCGLCLTHLGWVFESPGKDTFYGLILNYLVQPD